MVPGLNERACQAAAGQSREWLVEALREQARRVPAPPRRRTDSRSGIAMARELMQRSQAIGGSAVPRLGVADAAWRFARVEPRQVAAAPSRFPRPAERVPTEAGR
jgi:hypothetical protein